MIIHKLLGKYKDILQKEVCESKKKGEKLPSVKGLPTANKVPLTSSTIAKGMNLKGEVRFQKELRINGNFEGKLISKGKVIVGPYGCIHSDVSLDEIEVYGRVSGNISVSRAIIRKTATVEGTVRARTLLVEEGAKITGGIYLIQHDADSVVSSAS